MTKNNNFIELSAPLAVNCESDHLSFPGLLNEWSNISPGQT